MPRREPSGRVGVVGVGGEVALDEDQPAALGPCGPDDLLHECVAHAVSAVRGQHAELHVDLVQVVLERDEEDGRADHVAVGVLGDERQELLLGVVGSQDVHHLVLGPERGVRPVVAVRRQPGCVPGPDGRLVGEVEEARGHNGRGHG